MKNQLHVRWQGAALLLVVAIVGALTVSLAPAGAAPGGGKAKVGVCHFDDDGNVKLLMVAERGARALLRKGDVQPGDAVPGLDGVVYDDQCRPVFQHAQVALDVLNEIRFGIDPPCDPAAVPTPCGPENGGLLPPVVWDQGLAELAAPIAADCPVFTPGSEAHPDGMASNIYLHSSPDPVTDAELAELAIENWAEKQIQYNALTGGSIRNGDTSQLSFVRLISATRVGMAVKADCPNNRGVAFMILDPAPADGPAYPPICDLPESEWGSRPCVADPIPASPGA